MSKVHRTLTEYDKSNILDRYCLWYDFLAFIVKVSNDMHWFWIVMTCILRTNPKWLHQTVEWGPFAYLISRNYYYCYNLLDRQIALIFLLLIRLVTEYYEKLRICDLVKFSRIFYIGQFVYLLLFLFSSVSVNTP